MSLEIISPERIQFHKKISKKEIDRIVENKNIQVLQTWTPVSNKSWQLINDILLVNRPDIEVRIFGSHKEICDLKFISILKNVQNLSVDGLMKTKNHETLTELENLKSLSVGIYDLENFNFLTQISKNIEKLSIEATHSKKPDLRKIEELKSIKRLYIEGHSKNIEVISELPKIENLTLRSITTDNLDFLSNLLNLWSLDIKLGGTNNITALEKIKNLKYLELWQIKNMKNIDVISNLTELQNLFLQSLPNIKEIPSLINLSNLRRIYLENMKGLNNLKEIEFAPSLEEFSFTMATKQNPEELLPVLKNKSIKRASAYFGSIKKNKYFNNLKIKYDIKEFELSEFKYI